ncbi:MAG: LysR family transcriptional regulator [Nannocystales bacterium]
MARFTDVDLLLGVADAGSFRGAAAKLGVNSSTISRGIQRLEEHLGAPLLMRNTRNVKLTDAGAEYVRHAKRAAVSLAEGERAVANLSNEVEGTVRVSCTNVVAHTFLRGIITDYLRDHPGARVDLVLTTRLVNPLLDDVDIAIRVGQRLVDSDLRNRVLFRSELIVVGTPEVASRLQEGVPAPVVAFRRPGTNEEYAPPLPRKTRFCADDFGMVLDAIRDGVGLGIVDDALVQEDLQRGRLVRVHHELDLGLGRMTYWAVYPKAGRLPPSTRTLLDAITAATAPSRSKKTRER